MYAIEEIARDPLLREEARVTLPMLERTVIGAGEAGVKRALQTLVVVFGVSEAARSSVFWGAYIRQLSDMPEQALMEAVEDYIGRPDAEFFPKPGPLRELARKRAEPAFRAVSRVRMALKIERPVTIDRGTVEERQAQVAEVLSSLRTARAEHAQPEGAAT